MSDARAGSCRPRPCVLVATLLAAMVVMSPLDLTRVAGSAGGRDLGGQRPVRPSATDYFPPTQPSPMLHYWSLSVEEQFYLSGRPC